MTVKTEVSSPATITITPDKMTVFLTLNENQKPGTPLTADEIVRQMRSLGVTYGINRELMEVSLEFYNEHGMGEENLIVAQGKPSVPGEHGKIEYLVKKPSMQILAETDGSIDFREFDSVTKVKKDQPVVRRIPPGPGEAGMSVLGIAIAAKSGAPVIFPQISHTTVHPSDSNLLVSTIDGCVIFYPDGIDLSDCYEVKGDVDFSTGNVRSEGSVTIQGDVKSGFEVCAKGMIMIYGMVEDAKISAGGDVIVKGGFVGKGAGTIESGQDVKLSFVRYQKVTADGSIFIEKEALDSTLHAKKTIVVRGVGLGLAGGSAFATKALIVSTLGTEGETKTIVTFGNDPLVIKQLAALKSRHEALTQKSAHLGSLLKEIQNSKKKSKDLFEALINKMEKTMELKTEIDIAMNQLHNQISSLINECKPVENPVLQVTGMVYPGATLICNGAKRMICDPLKHRLFKYERGEIVDSHLTGV
jgi:uncharacterized protein (DUF342 family)